MRARGSRRRLSLRGAVRSRGRAHQGLNDGHDRHDQGTRSIRSTAAAIVCRDGRPSWSASTAREPGYIERAIEAGRAPWLARVLTEGTSLIADCVMPSFTNPNNLSIVTGRPPAVHGISGNYFLDPDVGQGGDDERRPVPAGRDAVPGASSAPAASIAVVTAKDKLRGLLGKGLALAPGKACSFSSEKSDKATLAENGIEGVNALVGMPVPDVYSAGLSEFVFAAGVKLMERDRPEIMYLSTTDYIQHKHAPGTPVANDFYAMMDGYLAQLDAMGCTIVLTADHGMNAKFGSDGQPDVIYLQDLFDGWAGKDKRARHPADHRSLRRASRRAGLVRRRLLRRCGEVEGEARGDAGDRAGADPGRGGEALRAAGRSARRPRGRLDQAQGAGHLGVAA